MLHHIPLIIKGHISGCKSKCDVEQIICVYKRSVNNTQLHFYLRHLL